MENKKKSRVTAIVLALLLGGIGVHYFYLEKYTAGIIMLLLCWTGIPSILGLVTGIRWAVQSEEKFNERYNK
ncbi:MAG: TM2 domain-containing membrane protein YozV [Flavobacteriaceae bacterium]|jgi:TM2 domain-containing membrane protein YozV